jgi:predicted TPR repeat methyltransferase
MSSAEDAREQWIERVYHASSKQELARHYDGWAESYDADMQAVGYVHPAAIAAFTARYVQNRNDAILDAGCGTGTAGNILAIAGFRNLLGLDLSEGMLARARSRDIYTRLEQAALGEQLPFETGSIAAIISTGVFTLGHAPASSFDELTRITRKGGHLMFSTGVTVWQEAGFAAKLDELIGAGQLMEVETSSPYQPMPYSKTESGYLTRIHVYRKIHD